MKAPARSGVAFAAVIALCLALVAWWLVFQFRETRRFERAAQALVAGDREAAAAALGVGADGAIDDRFRRQRMMFASEGAVLIFCVMIAVAVFYASLVRERRIMRERDRFLAGATHEFKTPIASIRLGLESLVGDRVSAAKREEYLRAMVGETDRLERAVTILLTASELRSGARRGLRLEPGDLVPDVGAVLAEFRPRFDAAGIELASETDSPAVVARDPAAIRMVVNNLLDNALRYSSRGDRVTLRLQVVGGFAELHVADTGLGIRSEDVGRVFEPFFRGVGGEHRGGSGLGLHLVREFVRMHGGTVAVRSEGTGCGSEFTVRLPVSEAA